MKTTLKLFIVCCLLGQFQTVEAQLLKRIIKRVENKVEQKIEKTVDNKIDSIGKEQPKTSKTTERPKDKVLYQENKENFGSTTLTHSKKYGIIQIDDISQVKVIKSNDNYKIMGNWWSHEADIYDGFTLIINTSQDLKQDAKIKHQVFKIPEEASLKLGYDPELLYKENDEDDFKAAVSDEYQNYDLIEGEVSIDVLTNGSIKMSFSGNMKLRKRTRLNNSIQDYSESFYDATIIGTLNGSSPQFIDNTTIKKTKSNTENSGNYSVSGSTSTTAIPGVYQFTSETVVKVTTSNDNQTYKMSYFLNPSTSYMAIKADMGEYSDEEMEGESLIVMDKGNTHIFVETAGMKMQMSAGQMGGQQSNPADEMTNYDYSKIKKTGNTKTILGAKCYEYVMADNEVKMNLWVAPEMNLPNWFIQNKDVLNGYIMEYTIVSKEGTMTSETIAIKNNISKTINPKDYKKMFN